MDNKDYCIFCDEKYEYMYGYAVCNKCGIILYRETPDVNLIYDYITKIEAVCKINSDVLHNIEQKIILHQNITDDEIYLKDRLIEFHELKRDIIFYMEHGQMREKHARETLYKLLLQSNDLENALSNLKL